MSTTLSEANALLRLAGLQPLPRGADADAIAEALADAMQILDRADDNAAA